MHHQAVGCSKLSRLVSRAPVSSARPLKQIFNLSRFAAASRGNCQPSRHNIPLDLLGRRVAAEGLHIRTDVLEYDFAPNANKTSNCSQCVIHHIRDLKVHGADVSLLGGNGSNPFRLGSVSCGHPPPRNKIQSGTSRSPWWGSPGTVREIAHCPALQSQ